MNLICKIFKHRWYFESIGCEKCARKYCNAKRILVWNRHPKVNEQSYTWKIIFDK